MRDYQFPETPAHIFLETILRLLSQNISVRLTICTNRILCTDKAGGRDDTERHQSKDIPAPLEPARQGRVGKPQGGNLYR